VIILLIVGFVIVTGLCLFVIFSSKEKQLRRKRMQRGMHGDLLPPPPGLSLSGFHEEDVPLEEHQLF